MFCLGILVVFDVWQGIELRRLNCVGRPAEYVAVERSPRLRWVRRQLELLCAVDRDGWTLLDASRYKILCAEENELLGEANADRGRDPDQDSKS